MGEEYSNVDEQPRDFLSFGCFFIVRNAEDDAIMAVMGDEICKRRDYR